MAKGITLEAAFEAILGLIILAGLVAIGVPIAVGFLINVTIPGASGALVTIFTALGSFVTALIGIYIIFKYALSRLKH
jgi:hypothetical protein